MHVCVLLWGFTAILGKLISLPAPALVLWRMGLVGVALLAVPKVRRGLHALGRRSSLRYAGIGVLVALHWVTFYAAIKLANASVAATCMALGPTFLAVLAPLLSRQPFNYRELLLGLLVVPAVALVVGGIPSDMQQGLVLGVISALFVAIFGLLNKRYVEHDHPLVITCVEMLAGALTIALLALAWGERAAFVIPGAHDALLLVVLAFGCTLLPFTLSLFALRHMSVFTAQLIVNLEPVYTIVLAVLLFGEQRELGLSFYVGGALILGVVFGYQPKA